MMRERVVVDVDFSAPSVEAVRRGVRHFARRAVVVLSRVQSE